VRSITFIPTGLLGLLPLHAAWREDPTAPSGRRYALDDLLITYVPSAQTLRHARAAATRPAETLLAVPYPDPHFQFADHAVEAALDLFAHRQALRHHQATLEAVKGAFDDYSVLFFFTHGHADFDEPLRSGLLTTDGWLTLGDIFDLHSEWARLAVLSACETGVPADLKTIDEFISLPGGLMQAGIPGVVGSLWSVAESSTALLMALFFENWRRRGLTPPQALRAAQQTVRDARFNPQTRAYFEQYLMPS
jgi:CHAT domain-containing protein